MSIEKPNQIIVLSNAEIRSAMAGLGIEYAAYTDETHPLYDPLFTAEIKAANLEWYETKVSVSELLSRESSDDLFGALQFAGQKQDAEIARILILEIERRNGKLTPSRAKSIILAVADNYDTSWVEGYIATGKFRDHLSAAN